MSKYKLLDMVHDHDKALMNAVLDGKPIGELMSQHYHDVQNLMLELIDNSTVDMNMPAEYIVGQTDFGSKLRQKVKEL